MAVIDRIDVSWFRSTFPTPIANGKYTYTVSRVVTVTLHDKEGGEGNRLGIGKCHGIPGRLGMGATDPWDGDRYP